MRLALILTLALSAFLAWHGRDFAAPPSAEVDRFKVLVFSKTAVFRHDSIAAGIEALRKLGKEHQFAVEATEDAALFESPDLKTFDVIVFLNTTGDILNDQQQLAMQEHFRKGKGFVGIHAAADTEYDWPWYEKLLGTHFASHPKIQPATIHVLDQQHPSTQRLPEHWKRTDEWYNFQHHPRTVIGGKLRLLAVLDETTYEGGTMPDEHPIAWCHEFEGGRSWYTAGGHTIESYREPEFLQHVLGGIEWAAGMAGDERSPATKPEK